MEAATNLLRMMMGKSVIFVSWVLLVVGNLSDFLLHGLGMKSETLKWCMKGISVSFFFFFLGWNLSTLGRFFLATIQPRDYCCWRHNSRHLLLMCGFKP